MPTNTRSPSWISRDATATISSCGVYSAIADAERLDVDAREVSRPVGNIEDPTLQPCLEALASAGRGRVIAKVRVIAIEIALDRGRMRSSRLMNDRHDLRLWKKDPVRMLEQGRRV